MDAIQNSTCYSKFQTLSHHTQAPKYVKQAELLTQGLTPLVALKQKNLPTNLKTKAANLSRSVTAFQWELRQTNPSLATAFAKANASLKKFNYSGNSNHHTCQDLDKVLNTLADLTLNWINSKPSTLPDSDPYLLSWGKDDTLCKVASLVELEDMTAKPQPSDDTRSLISSSEEHATNALPTDSHAPSSPTCTQQDMSSSIAPRTMSLESMPQPERWDTVRKMARSNSNLRQARKAARKKRLAAAKKAGQGRSSSQPTAVRTEDHGTFGPTKLPSTHPSPKKSHQFPGNGTFGQNLFHND